MGGYLMQLQNFSVNDGDGIRTVVFMASCPLRLVCQPRGSDLPQRYDPLGRNRGCAEKAAPAGNFLPLLGRWVTFSGGEATAQPHFLAELVDALYDDGISLALETCGQFDFAALRPVLQKMDLLFMGLKHPDTQAHRRFTGQGNETILENLQKAAALGVPLVVRIPTIVGVNADDATMEKAFTFISSHCPGAKLELLPYHCYGEGKYAELGLPRPSADFAAPTKAQLARWEALAAQQYGIEVVSYK